MLVQNKPSHQPGTHKMKRPDNGVLPIGNANTSNKAQGRQEPSQRNKQPVNDNYNPYTQAEPDRNIDHKNFGGDIAHDRSDYDPYKYNNYEADNAGQRNHHAGDDEDEFQRRLAEYRRAEANLDRGNMNDYDPGMEGKNPYSYQDEFPQYAREQNSPYDPQQRDDDRRGSPQGYNPYNQESEPQGYGEPHGSNPYKQGAQLGSEQDAHSKQPSDDKRVQRNYMVNNPLAPDAPQKRAPGGFRAHQEITHDSMGIARPNKIPMNQGNATDAYKNIKKKYGNHSAQYNILTGV